MRDKRSVRKRIVEALMVSITLVIVATLAAQPHQEPRRRSGLPAVPGEYVVFVQSGWENKVRALHASVGAKVVRRTVIGERILETVMVEGSSAAILAQYRSTGPDIVQSAEPNYLYYPSRDSTDPFFSSLWGLRNEGKEVDGLKATRGADINVTTAWDMTTGSQKVIIAVIDTGIDWQHRDLKDRIWRNEEEREDNDRDDDNNGFRDDVRGWDFGDSDNDPADENGHGTHVAGTIGATPNNNVDIVGVMWDVKLMALKAMDRNGRMRLDALAAAVAYAINKKAHVINASWGGGGNSEVLRKVIDDARRANILFVAAAGNEGLDNDLNPTYPANYPVDNIISVAATGPDDQRPGWSNYGKKSVHVAAPGVRILSLIPGSKIAYSDGTSMAAPHVTGIAGLILSRHPGLGVAAVKDHILKTVDAVPSLKDRTVTGGRVNAGRAVK